MIAVYSVAVPEYVRGVEPDFLTVSRKLDRAIEAHFRGDIAIRGLSVVDHPGKTLDDLVATIVELGTDRYDPQRKAVLHELFGPYGVELHALPCSCTIEDGLRSPLIEATSVSVMEDVVGDFYWGPPVDRDGPPIRLDLLTVYDLHQLNPIYVPYDGKPREQGETHEYRFKHPDRKPEALLGIVKIL